ncbi:MAG: hypothetical protein U1D35_14045, partial [Paracoccaceae bacterium]|nr:hypothetical protein [Paracoccaceae bacterium]
GRATRMDGGDKGLHHVAGRRLIDHVIARQVGLTLIGRMRGQWFVCLAGEDRLIRDADPALVADEGHKHGRKGGTQ